MKPTIMIGLTQGIGFNDLFIENLKLNGFNAVDISYNDNHFEYQSWWERTYNFLRKVFLNDKEYKSRLKFQRHGQHVLRELKKIKNPVEYTLLIRADLYPKYIFNEIRTKSKILVGYQWDGLHRFPAIYKHLELFDRFFVFDKNDIQYKGQQFLPLTNFYFNLLSDNQEFKVKHDVFFVGSLIEKRMPAILNFIEKCNTLNLTTDIHLYSKENVTKPQYLSSPIHFMTEHMSYENNINRLRESKIALDFLNQTHEGLSFRTFEALHYDKKLITNNVAVSKYDFYHPNNIFIWNESNLDQLEEFISLPYVTPSQNIKEKYGFGNWIKYVLDLDEYESITLPQ